ncbi:MAG: hypothetical protein E6R05_03295 [Candidatus Moraniibacteriota bacterium]|nr:MAG: hypothetical protein E6R05_03295 [Candidatus Moranbacteria bacterium]
MTDLRPNQVVVATGVMTGSAQQVQNITLPGGYTKLEAVGFNPVKALITVTNGNVTYFSGRADDVAFSLQGAVLNRDIPETRSLVVTMTPLESQTLTDVIVTFRLS